MWFIRLWNLSDYPFSFLMQCINNAIAKISWFIYNLCFVLFHLEFNNYINGAIWPSLSPCPAINPISFTHTLHWQGQGYGFSAVLPSVPAAQLELFSERTRFMPWLLVSWLLPWPGVCPINGISIECEIRPKFVVLWFKICSTEHNEILHMSRQLHCRDVCKISLWSVKYIWN